MSRVLVLLHSAKPAGAELATMRMLPYLPGDQPTVVISECGPMVDTLRAEGVRVDVAPLPEWIRGLKRDRRGFGRQFASVAGLLLYGAQLSRQYRDIEVSAVWSHSIKTALIGWFIARRVRVPHVWALHDHISNEYFGRWARVIRWVIPRFADAIIVNSVSTLKTLGSINGKTLCLSPSLSESVHFRARTFESPLRIGMISRLSPWKGQNVFVEALILLAREAVFEADIAGAALFGEVQFESALRHTVDLSGLSNRIHFLGHVQDIGALLDGLDIVVHASSLPEPFGMVVIEGMAAGCIVVAANAGGPTETIQDGRTGFLVEPGSPDILACQLKRVMDADPQELILMAARASYEAKRYAASVLGDSLSAFFIEVCNSAREKPKGGALHRLRRRH